MLVVVLAAACFFGGIRFERERQRREDEAAALAASNAERQAAQARARQRMVLVASELDLQRRQTAAEVEARERINRELFLQEQKVDQLMARFNALVAEEERRAAKPAGARQLELEELERTFRELEGGQ